MPSWLAFCSLFEEPSRIQSACSVRSCTSVYNLPMRSRECLLVDLGCDGWSLFFELALHEREQAENLRRLLAAHQKVFDCGQISLPIFNALV
jgi:hypothetical protein